MSFLSPYMLWGALAAGIPIALHFFYRSRYRKLPWAAMKFLLTSIDQTSRRLKFQELLLLLLRATMLVLLALALARPSTKADRGPAQGDAVDAVMVFDVSASMGACEGPASRLEQARSAALAVIDQLPEHSTVQVIVGSDRATLLGPRIPGDLDAAKQLIGEIQLSHQATDLLPGVVEAAQALARGQAPNKELYLFSDMQKRGWDHQADPLTDALRALGKKSTVYLVRAGSREPRNVAVAGIVPQSGIPHTGARAGFAVLVRNTGKEPLRNLRVSLTVAGQEKRKETQPIVELASGSTQAIPITVKLDKAGLCILSAQVEADELEADNHFDQVLFVRDHVRVLVVDGAADEREVEKSASFFLMHALAPVHESERSKHHVQPRMVPSGQAAAGLLAEQDVCILTNVAVQEGQRRSASLPPDFARYLANFVHQGHGLIIFTGDNVSADAYNRLFFDRHKLLPAKLGPVIDLPPDKPVYLDRGSLTSPFFWKFREDEHYLSINKVEVRRSFSVDEPPRRRARAAPLAEDSDSAVNVLLRYSDGKPAVITRKVGSGEVMLITTTADLQWTDWSLRFGVPFLDAALSQFLQTQSQNLNVRAGTPVHWNPPESDLNRAFAVVGPDGNRQRLGLPAIEKGRPILTASHTPRAGIYRIVSAEPAEKEPIGVPFAVVPDLRETENLETWTDTELDQRLDFPVIHLAAGADATTFVGAERLKREWTMWLLVAVLVVALTEAGLAWLCGRTW